MKKLTFIALCLFMATGYAQTTFPVTQTNGSPTTIVITKGAFKADTLFVNAVYADTAKASANPYVKNYRGGQIFTTSDNSVWYRNATATKWLKYATGGEGWALLGNSGTTAGTNFIGTTDNQDIVFKRGNIFAGRLGTGFSVGGAGNFNTSFGTSSHSGVLSTNNAAFGDNALGATTTGSFNTGLGSSALISNITGSNNIAIGNTAGFNNIGSNKFYLNGIARTTLAGDTTLSLLYGEQTAAGTAASGQRLKVNAQLHINDGSQGAGKVFTSDAAGIGSWITPVTPTAASVGAWSLTGNSGTTASNFIGTTDAQPLNFRSKNVPRMVIDTLGNVGIGITNPNTKLDVAGWVNTTAGFSVRATSFTSGVPANGLPNISGDVATATYSAGSGGGFSHNFTTGATSRLYMDDNGVTIGSTTPVTPSIFTVTSTLKGSIPMPIMTNTQMGAIAAPIAGLHVFNSSTKLPP